MSCRHEIKVSDIPVFTILSFDSKSAAFIWTIQTPGGGGRGERGKQTVIKN